MHLSLVVSIVSVLLPLLPSVSAIAHPTITPAPGLPQSLGLRSPNPSPDKISIKPFTLASIHLDLPSNTCHPTIAPDKNGFVPPTECNALYRFYPSFAAAVIFSLLFGMVTVAHFVQAVAYRKKFCWVIITAATWETGSFITRSISTRHQQSDGLLLVSQLLVLLAPLWINAFIYMLLARMVYYYIPSHSLFRIQASTFALTFVSLDFVSFVIQLVGGSMAPPGAPHDEVMRGIHVYMGGIGMQEAFIVFFVVLVVQFHTRMLQLERNGTLKNLGREPAWRSLLYTMYASLVLITIRIIFRLTEFSAGEDPSNPLPFHEIYFYAFEAVPMFVALTIMSVAHPAYLAPRSSYLEMASSFLLCPAEIREQIYRDVLSSSSAKQDSGLSECCAHYNYQLNILRANRQIHNEATKIFRDNIFVKITTPWPEAIEHISSEGKVPVVTAGEKAERFTDFHLWVYIDAPAAPRNHETHSMIICLEDLEAFTWTWHYNNLNYPGLNTHLSLKLTIQDPYIFDRKVPKPLQQRLLLPFGVIKDLSVFSAHGSKLLPSVKDSLVKAQAVPDPTREECLEKATSLKESGTKALEAGEYRQALQQYFDAFEAIHIRINGRKRTIHADGYYIEELKTGIYKGQRGDYVRMVLRIGLVSSVVLAYLTMKEYTEAHFWGKRSIVLFRQSIIGDETEDIEIDGTPSWIMDTVGMHVPAKKELGYIFYRTALASRALGKEADVKTLIKAAAVYLPDDQGVQAEKRALDRQQPLDSWLRRVDT